MTTIAEKKARIAKLKRLGRDVSKYEAKLIPKEPPEDGALIVEVKPVRRIGRPPRVQ
jgi:hypothetical protein